MPSIAITFQKIKSKFKILQQSGTSLRKDTNQISAISRNKIIKIIIALILSNLFFSMLFSDKETPKKVFSHSGIEIIIEGKLFTSFEKNKTVLLTHAGSGLKIKAVLIEEQSNSESYLVITSEKDALKILAHPRQWRIIPFLKDFSLQTPKTYSQEIDHEIHF